MTPPHRAWLFALLLLPLGVPGRPVQADETSKETVQKAAAALYEGIRTETLPNGLRVYIKRVPDSPVVTTMVAYKVGSADENLDQTGLSHYLEHLMFKGTDKLMPGDIDRQTLRTGGANNAYTSEDHTIFHFDMPAEKWEVPLAIEADRMRNLRIDAKHEFEQEKGNVISELEGNEDQPWDLESKMILPLIFGPKAPYGHPVIGEREHVRGATADIIKSHYDKWYHPNNAALVIVGGIDPDKVFAKVKELFGSIPMKKLPERKDYTAIQRKGPVVKTMESKFEVPRLLMGFNSVRSGEPDAYPREVIQALLSGGKTSRFYKKLVEGEEIASAADASSSPGRYPGWFAISVELLKGKDINQAEKLVLAELKKLATEPVPEAELRRIKQKLVASAVFGRESVHALADSIAQGVTTNDLDYLKNYMPRIMAVTPADIQRVAKKYLDAEQRVVIRSMPRKDATGGEKGEKGAKAQRAAADKDAMPGGGFSLKNAQVVTLPNGLTLLLLENRRLPIVVAQASVRDVKLHEPADKAGVANMVGRLLDEGTSKHKGSEIAELIENVGGGLGFSSTGGSVKVLTPDRKLGLGLLLECLTDPAFPKDAFVREQNKLLSEIEDADSKPEAKASQVYRQTVYGKHPLGRPGMGTQKTVSALTPADCRAFHRQVFVPNNVILAIVGDFDSKQVIEEVKSLTADWKNSPIKKPATPTVAAPEKFTQKVVTMPDAVQLYFFMGHPGIRRDNPDFYKLLVMDYVLGTGPGFTDRLSAQIRDREGLGYTVSANMTNSAGEEPGLFTCYVGTKPENFAKVKSRFLEEIKRIRAETPTKEEVEDAKKYLLGNLPFRFTSNEGIAGELIEVQRFGLGFGYLDDFRKKVAAVTPEDVQAVAKKYLDPEHMVLVVAGAVDAKGEPLGKLPAPKK
jgi:zinc protease